MARTERESDRRRREVADLLVLPRPAKSFAEWRRLQQENLSILGVLKRKGWPQCHKESSWQIRRSRFCQRERNRAVFPEHEIVRRAFSVREVKRTAAEERERDEYSSAEGQ